MPKWTSADIPEQTGASPSSPAPTRVWATRPPRHSRPRCARRARRAQPRQGQDAALRIAQASPGAKVDLQELDLTSLDSVRSAAEQLKSDHDAIDLLINNAGVMFTPKSTTKDGFELQFGTNHLGHFAFTASCSTACSPHLDRAWSPSAASDTASPVKESASTTSSGTANYSRVGAYGQAKLAKPAVHRLSGHWQSAALHAEPTKSITSIPATMSESQYSPADRGEPS